MRLRNFISAAVVGLAVFSVNALDATVVSANGKVEVQGGSEWKPLSQGDVVSKGSVISTGFKSEAVFSVKGSQFTLGPLTRATLENLISTTDKDSTQIYIDSGSLKADVNGQNGKRVGFKVRSPVATASVRGTSFNMTCSGRLSVTKGLVSYGPAESKEAHIENEVTEVEETSFEISPAEATASDEPVMAEVPEASPEQAPSKAPVAKNDKEPANADGKEETAAPASQSKAAPANNDKTSVASTPKTTVFTSAKAVGEANGVPVAKGQKSKATQSGSISSPVSEMKSASAPKAIVPISVTEAVATNSSGNNSSSQSTPVGANVTETATAAAITKTATGSLSVLVTFE